MTTSDSEDTAATEEPRSQRSKRASDRDAALVVGAAILAIVASAYYVNGFAYEWADDRLYPKHLPLLRRFVPTLYLCGAVIGADTSVES